MPDTVSASAYRVHPDRISKQGARELPSVGSQENKAMTATTLQWNPASEPPEHNRRVLVLWWSQWTGYCYGIIARRTSSWRYVKFWSELPDPELFGNSEELENEE